MVNSTRNIDLVRESAQRTLDQVVPPPNSNAAHGSGGGDEIDSQSQGTDSSDQGKRQTAYDHAVAKAVQSVAQTTAVAVQDAANLMRNISTEETVAIGVAMAKWIESPENVMYEKVINKSLETIKETARAYQDIGVSAIRVLQQLRQ